MATPDLSLNIPGAAGNVAGLNTSHGRIMENAENVKATFNKLAGPDGATSGTSANTVTDFSVQINSATNATGDTVQGATKATNGASQNTIGFDQGFRV